MIYIEKATEKDIEGIVGVNIQSWRETYTGLMPQKLLDELSFERGLERRKHYMSLPDTNLFVAKDQQDMVVGYLDGGKSRMLSQYDCEIYAFYLLKKYHRQGIGRKLFNAQLAYFKQQKYQSMYICVLRESPTVEVYKALGGRLSDIKLDHEFGGVQMDISVFVWDKL